MRIPHLVLGISDNAADAEIRSRYLELVKQYPPETAPVRFQQITEAYEALRNRRKRIETTLFGDMPDTGDFAGRLTLLADAVEVRRRRAGLRELFEMEKRCSKK
ncbi:J domain-containing protein [Desulfococcus sp.]|uniref:J domain-containing protein n=1 Tax=Desulfococcus sp. TaxID=2025834 RepID=UPI0035943BA3